MKVTKTHKLIVDLSVEAKKFEEENGQDPFYEDYRRNNKIRLVGDLESPMLRWLSKAYPSSANPKVKVLSTDPLVVRLKFDTVAIVYPD